MLYTDYCCTLSFSSMEKLSDKMEDDFHCLSATGEFYD